MIFYDFKQSLEKSHEMTQANHVHKEKDDSINEEFIENQEYVLTKMSISKIIKLYTSFTNSKATTAFFESNRIQFFYRF